MEGETQDGPQTTATVADARGEPAKAGLPQLQTETFAGQIFWLVITFAFLYLVISRLAAPKIGGVIDARNGRIRGDVDKAAEAKRKSEEALAGYDKALADARARALRLSDDVRKQVQDDADKKSAAASERLAGDTAKAETRIAEMRTAAMANVATLARDVAGDIVTKLTGETISAGELSAAVAGALKRS